MIISIILINLILIGLDFWIAISLEDKYEWDATIVFLVFLLIEIAIFAQIVYSIQYQSFF